MGKSHSYIVVLKHVVVAEDLAQAIREHDPAAEVAVGRTLALLPAACAPRLAFLGLDPAEAMRRAEVQALLARGTRLVLIGEAAEAAGEGPDWWVLPRPFTTAAVLALLERAAEEGSADVSG